MAEKLIKPYSRKMHMYPRTVRFPAWMWEALEDLSFKEYASISSIVRRVVKEYLIRKGYKPPVDEEEN